MTTLETVAIIAAICVLTACSVVGVYLIGRDNGRKQGAGAAVNWLLEGEADPGCECPACRLHRMVQETIRNHVEGEEIPSKD